MGYPTEFGELNQIGYNTFVGKSGDIPFRVIFLHHKKVLDFSRLYEQLYPLGYPKIIKIVRNNSDDERTYLSMPWTHGEDLSLLKQKKQLTPYVFFLWGQELARIHNAGVSVTDCMLKNFIYDGIKVWLIDVEKIYSSDFPEYDLFYYIINRISFREMNDALDLKDAFIEGYRTKRPFDWTLFLDKCISYCHDNYQDILLNGNLIKKGARSSKRVSMLSFTDFNKATVLDLGCSCGMLSRIAARFADRAFGVDSQARDGRYYVTTLANLLAFLEGVPASYEQRNMEVLDWRDSLAVHDVVFFCAILGHLSEPREPHMKWIDKITGKVLYYESNLGGKKDETERWLRNTTTFSRVDYLGDSGDNERGASYAFFRCER